LFTCNHDLTVFNGRLWSLIASADVVLRHVTVAGLH